jgi:hypothetical protein
MRTLKLPLLLGCSLVSFQVLAQDNPPPAAPATTTAPAAAAPPAPPPPSVASPAAGASDASQAPGAPPSSDVKKKGRGPSLSVSPEAPAVGGLVVSPAEPAPVVEEAPTSEWKFDVTGYFRAPVRFSWGPPTAPDPRGGDAGTQLRSPPLVPDANYVDWRYTNSMVGPWTELNFHYGNDRVKATVQIASYNQTDPGFRRLESNLGINLAFLTISFPELFNLEDLHLTLTVGGFTNRYGAAGRYDGGKYETYLIGRTHVMGENVNVAYDVGDWTFQVEEGFGAKIEPIPFYGAPGSSANPNTMLPAWEPYPGPLAQEPTFVAHAHVGAVFKKELILGAHLIDTFANGNELSSAYQQMAFGARPSTGPGSEKPSIVITGVDAKLLGGVLGDGYLGYSHVSATNAVYLADAIEVIHSFGGWQLHDNFFGTPGGTEPVTGTIDSVEFQYVFSFGQLFHYPQAFWGDGPDLIAAVFTMFNHVHAPMNPAFDKRNKLKGGAEVTYIPLPWLGVGGRYDFVRPNMDDSQQNFSVFSPRIILRSAFVTHEQILIQYSHYFYGPAAAQGQFPFNGQPGAAGIRGADKNAFTMAAIIWF